MFTRCDRWRPDFALEVDKWGHGIRVRVLDNRTGERTASAWIDRAQTVDLVITLAGYVGIKLEDPSKDKQQRLLALQALRDAIDALMG